MRSPKMYSIPEAAYALGFAYVTVYGWVKKGLIPSYNFNGTYKIAERDLKAFIKTGYRGTRKKEVS